MLKNIVQWNYKRGSWQWDVLCILILIFIFLTPKTWFDKREKLATQTSRLIVKAQDFSAKPFDSDRQAAESRVRELSGNPNAEIVDVREKKDDKGNIFYEIDIK